MKAPKSPLYKVLVARHAKRGAIGVFVTALLISLGSFAFVRNASAVYYNLGMFWKKSALLVNRRDSTHFHPRKSAYIPI